MFHHNVDNMKTPNSKSLSILKSKEMLQQIPYDNYLKDKDVNLPMLKKRPRDRKVVLEIEKINQKKQEKEYKKYLERQIKEFRD
mmetsp:Transcript_9222/g.8631  ORF Transcript_9222/g.8631 Transcript_9222/m.8631 type:complete len:84 (+) Transcript_9222:613-864(+)